VRGLGALALAAAGLALLLVATAPERGLPAELAAQLRLPEPQELDLPDPSYQSGFPESYFASAPNPTAKYAWVCPGPSRLDDSHSAACPESGTGGYRCCIDSATGGAVTDDMCCPAQEKQLKSSLRVPSTRSLAKRLGSTLERVVLKLEKQAQPKPPKVKASYISQAEAQADLDSYFSTLAGSPAPRRSLASPEAKDDLDSFFHELKKGTLAGLAFQRKPWKAPPLPDPTQEVGEVSRDYAKQVRSDMLSKGTARAKQLFENWRERSMRHRRRPSVMKVAAAEEAQQQNRARHLGKATADLWRRKQVHYYTATLGGREDDDDAVDLGDGLVGIPAAGVSATGER